VVVVVVAVVAVGDFALTTLLRKTGWGFSDFVYRQRFSQQKASTTTTRSHPGGPSKYANSTYTFASGVFARDQQDLTQFLTL